MSNQDREFMMRAVELARHGMETNSGGPFGCVVVRDGAIVGEGSNCVTSTNDPTAHAEVVAIRNACANLGTFQLDGCTIYTSCEPCPKMRDRSFSRSPNPPAPTGCACGLPTSACFTKLRRP